MARIAYVNGRYSPLSEAMVNIEDRGYQFADGIYEVVALVNACLIDEEQHLGRLWRSLEALQIAEPMSRGALKQILREVVRRNRLRDGMVYIQVTRGVAPRDHHFPQGTRSAISIYVKPKNIQAVLAKAATGVSVISIPDLRWKRCDIKSISLLPNCLGKQKATEQGAYEAWQIDGNGLITEGTSSNAWIVDAAGTLRTRAVSPDILRGITRDSLLDLASQQNTGFAEEAFTLKEALQAKEAFLTSATSFVMPVVRIDQTVIADGKPGPVAKALLRAYETYMNQTGKPVPGMERP